MLKYQVPKSKETELREFPITDFYVSPELNYISGVTDYNIGLINGEEVVIKNNYLIGSEVNTVNTKDARRQGRVGVKIVLEVKEITRSLRFPVLYDYEEQKKYIVEKNKKVYEGEDDNWEDEYIVREVTQKYVEYNGDISYFYDGEDIKGYLVNHKFYEVEVEEPDEESEEEEEEETDEKEYLEIETYLYIEDGKLVVGDTDFSKVNEIPVIKRYENDINKIAELIDEYDNVYAVPEGEEPNQEWLERREQLEAQMKPIKPDMYIGTIDGNKCYALGDENGNLLVVGYLRSEWKRVTKFSILKKEYSTITPEEIMFGGYRNFVEYAGENYYLTDAYDEKGNYLGFGFTINDKFYKPTLNYGIEELYKEHNDLPYESNVLYVSDDEEYVEIQSTIVSFTDGGRFIILIDTETHDDIQEGNYIIAIGKKLI